MSSTPCLSLISLHFHFRSGYNDLENHIIQIQSTAILIHLEDTFSNQHRTYKKHSSNSMQTSILCCTSPPVYPTHNSPFLFTYRLLYNKDFFFLFRLKTPSGVQSHLPRRTLSRTAGMGGVERSTHQELQVNEDIIIVYFIYFINSHCTNYILMIFRRCAVLGWP